MSPQPSSFVGYIENYGIKLWRPFKQQLLLQYSMGQNGHRPKWSLRKHPYMFYTPSFTLLYSRKGEMRGTQNEGLFSGLD